MQQSYVRYVLGINLYKPKDHRDADGRRLRIMTAKLWSQEAPTQSVRSSIFF